MHAPTSTMPPLPVGELNTEVSAQTLAVLSPKLCSQAVVSALTGSRVPITLKSSLSASSVPLRLWPRVGARETMMASSSSSPPPLLPHLLLLLLRPLLRRLSPPRLLRLLLLFLPLLRSHLLLPLPPRPPTRPRPLSHPLLLTRPLSSSHPLLSRLLLPTLLPLPSHLQLCHLRQRTPPPPPSHLHLHPPPLLSKSPALSSHQLLLLHLPAARRMDHAMLSTFTSTIFKGCPRSGSMMF